MEFSVTVWGSSRLSMCLSHMELIQFIIIVIGVGHLVASFLVTMRWSDLAARRLCEPTAATQGRCSFCLMEIFDMVHSPPAWWLVVVVQTCIRLELCDLLVSMPSVGIRLLPTSFFCAINDLAMLIWCVLQRPAWREELSGRGVLLLHILDCWHRIGFAGGKFCVVSVFKSVDLIKGKEEIVLRAVQIFCLAVWLCGSW
jgi:hypothetical protein